MPKKSLAPVLFIVVYSASIVLGGRQYSSLPIDGATHIAVVTNEMLRKSPTWEKDAENPPLSARRALKLAEQYVDASVRPNKEWKRELDSIGLVQDDDKWFWKADFLWYPRMGSLEGHPPNCTVIILMDGTVVAGEKKEIKGRRP